MNIPTLPIRILLIAPYIGLIKLFEEAIYNRTDMVLTSYECDTVHVPALIKSLSLDNYDIIISRGYTCKMIQANCDRQVFDVGISIYDAFRVIRLACDYNGRTAIVGFKSVIYYAAVLKDMLNYPIDIYTIDKIDQIKDQLQALKKLGYTMIVGDVITCVTSKQLGLQSMLITTSPENVESVLDNCETAFHERIKLRHDNLFLTEAMCNLPEGIVICSDSSKILYTSQELPPELLTYLQKNVPLILEKQNHTLIRSLGEFRYTINGGIFILPDNPCIIFSCRKTKRIHKSNLFLCYHNKDEFNDISQRIFFTQNTRLKNLFSSIQSFNYISRPVIIKGPRGIGKDQFAFYLHQHCSRHNIPMAVIDCEYADSNTWNAFLNKEDSPIYFSNYTIYFKNLEYLSLEQQNELLFTTKSTNLYSRNQLIFSYDSDNAQNLNQGRLMGELLNSVNSLVISVPALKERSEDIPNYVTLYLNEFNAQLAKQVIAFDPSALELMQHYNWPGNLYQMKKVIQELILFSNSLLISADEVKAMLDKSEVNYQPKNSSSEISLTGTLDEIIRQVVAAVLKEENSNQTKAAKRLGIGRSTLRRHLGL